jgi:hypothetical protein
MKSLLSVLESKIKNVGMFSKIVNLQLDHWTRSSACQWFRRQIGKQRNVGGSNIIILKTNLTGRSIGNVTGAQIQT